MAGNMNPFRLTFSRFILLAFFMSCSLHSLAQQDSISGGEIDTVTVVAAYSQPHLSNTANGGVRLSTDILNDLPQIFGNADPMRYTQMMPGVQTNSEYDSGIHIEGCDNTHNFVSINNTPVYNAAHLLGFFSVFNPTHFSSVDIKKNANSPADPSRLGGYLNMATHNQAPQKTTGNVDVGLISSQGSIHIPLPRHQLLSVSARRSYINLLYSQWLNFDGSQLRYSFYDTNISYLNDINTHHQFGADLYLGNDQANIEDVESLGLDIQWGNRLAALHYNYNGTSIVRSHNSVYYSGYYNKTVASVTEARGRSKAAISTVGFRDVTTIGHFICGADIALHTIRPQDIATEGTYNTLTPSDISQHTAEYSAFVSYKNIAGRLFDYEAGARASIYNDNNGNIHKAVDPSIMLNADIANWHISFSYSSRHQYIFQTGFSSMGLPTEFWTSSNNLHKPQHSHGFNIKASTLLFDSAFGLTIESYYKKLQQQNEYHGTMLDFITSSAGTDGNILHGDGYNYGANIIINKRKGILRGWISYSYGKAQRRFSEYGYKGYYPSSHERPHELNAVATYRLNDHFRFGATYVLASGAPFTAPRHFYLLNGTVISEYGRHNANRLGAYSRLDFSANITLRKTDRYESGLNISVYNATARRNPIYYHLKYRDDAYKYSMVNLFIKVLPSVSYYFRF